MTSLETFSWLAGGYFLVQTYETVFGDQPAQKGVNYWMFDPEHDKFRIIFSNNGPYSDAGNRYAGRVADRELTLDGPFIRVDTRPWDQHRRCRSLQRVAGARRRAHRRAIDVKGRVLLPAGCLLHAQPQLIPKARRGRRVGLAGEVRQQSTISWAELSTTRW